MPPEAGGEAMSTVTPVSRIMWNMLKWAEWSQPSMSRLRDSAPGLGFNHGYSTHPVHRTSTGG